MTKTTYKHKVWLVLVMMGCLVASGCNGNSAINGQGGTPGPGQRSAEEVFIDFLDAIDDTVQHSGTDWPAWDRNHTAGFFPPPCSVQSRDDGRAYQTQIEGGPVDDPRAAVERMRTHWESKGYKIGNVFDNMGANTTGIEIGASTPRGMILIFTPSKHTSFINVQSECTLDPSAKKVTA
ncbi:hypothetical protein ACFUOZ_15925 [Paenarthrobacter sp. NPDC057355]|uniref:hypothetical protein n=1 Tax=Paenarthrobacter sp. NPDC057355 TaxID=3346105 RepID=UPI003625BA36